MDCSGSSGTSSSSKGEGEMSLASLSPTTKPQDLTRAGRKLDVLSLSPQCLMSRAAVGPVPEGPIKVTT
eukprot:7474576-Pyramimonas_sp.AAC.1